MNKKYWGEKSPTKQNTQGSKAEKHISVHENKIYYYSNVNRDSASELNKKIGEIESKSLTLNNTLDLDQPPSIRIYINSGGGSVTAGISSMDTILRTKVPIHTYVDGFAASAATFLSVVGTKRFMSRNSYMLIHQLSGAMWGKFAAMRDDMQNSEMLMEKIKKIYREHTRIPEDVLEDILKRDLWWEAEKCLEYGLVDEII